MGWNPFRRKPRSRKPASGARRTNGTSIPKLVAPRTKVEANASAARKRANFFRRRWQVHRQRLRDMNPKERMKYKRNRIVAWMAAAALATALGLALHERPHGRQIVAAYPGLVLKEKGNTTEISIPPNKEGIGIRVPVEWIPQESREDNLRRIAEAQRNLISKYNPPKKIGDKYFFDVESSITGLIQNGDFELMMGKSFRELGYSPKNLTRYVAPSDINEPYQGIPKGSLVFSEHHLPGGKPTYTCVLYDGDGFFVSAHPWGWEVTTPTGPKMGEEGSLGGMLPNDDTNFTRIWGFIAPQNP